MKTREEALALLNEYTKSESLIRHALAVEAAMKWYAAHFNQNEEETRAWCLAGLLHDFDYERFPTGDPPDGHPFRGAAILTELGYPADVVQAILGHGNHTGVARESLMAKVLFAVDELSGFVMACSLVLPDKSLHSVKASSVKKKMKDKAFARACSREDITQGAEELGVALEDHIQNVITAMRG
jgi:predicted hydrolase (HD superfamily)